MTDQQQPLIIKDFQQGIADSPHLGHALMRNMDIEIFPGTMKVQKKFLPMIISSVQQTFTADAASDVCTAAGSLLTQAEIDTGNAFTGAAVTFTTTGTLPAGLSLATTYFLIEVTATTFKVATTWANSFAGTAINITDAGTGVHTVVPTTVGSFKQLKKSINLNYYFALDSLGQVWNTRGGTAMYLLPGNTLTNGKGNGLIFFKSSDNLHTWMFIFRNDKIDVIDVQTDALINAAGWTNGWQTLNSTAGSNNNHFGLLGQDNIVYYCDDRFVGSILEKAGQVFDPTSGATYTFNSQALDLPLNEVAASMEEMGAKLLTGGLTFNKIYPWDRISPSFALPLSVPETGIYVLKNLGNMVYIFAGTKGNIYSTQGTYVTNFKTIPGYIRNASATLTPSPIAWGGVAVSNGALLFGMSSQVTGNSGIYKLYPDGRLLQDNTPYSGSQQVYAIWADTDFYFIGTIGSVEYSFITRYVQGTFASVYQSALYPVGNKTQKASFSDIEIQLANPPSTGQIRLGYRFDLISAFTTTSASTFTADSVTTSFENNEFGITDIENIQIQLEFDGEIEPLEVRLTP